MLCTGGFMQYMFKWEILIAIFRMFSLLKTFKGSFYSSLLRFNLLNRNFPLKVFQTVQHLCHWLSKLMHAWLCFACTHFDNQWQSMFNYYLVTCIILRCTPLYGQCCFTIMETQALTRLTWVPLALGLTSLALRTLRLIFYLLCCESLKQ